MSGGRERCSRLLYDGLPCRRTRREHVAMGNSPWGSHAFVSPPEGIPVKLLILDMNAPDKTGATTSSQVFLAVKKFDTRGGSPAIYGPYSGKQYKTPIGRWTKGRKDVRMCARGWHVTTSEHAFRWGGHVAYIVEARGKFIIADTKAVFSQIRLVKRLPSLNARLIRRELKKYIAGAGREAMPSSRRPRARSRTMKCMP